jgi:hypothetical protein
MSDLANPQPMTAVNPFQPALVRNPTNEARLGMADRRDASAWEQGASWCQLADGSRAINWHGLLLEGWQPIHDTTPRYPLPDDCRP